MDVSKLIELGELLERLKSPRLRPALGVTFLIDRFIITLKDLGFNHTSESASALNELKPIKYDHDDPYKHVNEESARVMQQLVTPIEKSLKYEAGQIEIITVDRDPVLSQLKSFHEAFPLTDLQTSLRSELIYCMSVGALKASMILAWNFGFDYIRQWVFDNHLSTFNAFLTSKYLDRKTSKPKYESIVDYEDFFLGSPGERTFLEVTEYSGILGRKKIDLLKALLHRRNDCAHPSFHNPSIDQVNAYTKDILNIISTSPNNK